jgi:radial spoke head protein 3
MVAMQGQVQQFASMPQAVGSRGKYRDPNDSQKFTANIMYDRRVVRGNTYAAVVQPEQDTLEIQKQREAQRRRLMRANQTRKRAGTPEAVPGRKHTDIQTDSYLEELTERTVEFEAETQTDFILDRPPSPLFMPAKIGVDIETQIEEGELFDFDVECEPVLEVLVGKTLEQSMMEVLEEEELASLQRHQEDFELRRNAELLEVQRMEAAEKRRHDEMQRRTQQQAAQRERDLSIMRKVVARSVAAEHLSGLKDRMLLHLKDAGIFADSTSVAVESLFLPTLLQTVAKQMQHGVHERQVVENILASSLTARLEKHRQVLEAERARLQALDDAERQARIDRALEAQRRQEEAQRILEELQAMADNDVNCPVEEPAPADGPPPDGDVAPAD